MNGFCMSRRIVSAKHWNKPIVLPIKSPSWRTGSPNEKSIGVKRQPSSSLFMRIPSSSIQQAGMRERRELQARLEQAAADQQAMQADWNKRIADAEAHLYSVMEQEEARGRLMELSQQQLRNTQEQLQQSRLELADLQERLSRRTGYGAGESAYSAG